MELPDPLTEAVYSLAREREVPVKSVLLAAHTMTLRLLSGQSDVTTGLVTHGRPEVEGSERMCGLFLNTMPMRVSDIPNSWFDAVREVVARERESYPHRRVPLAVIQEDLGSVSVVDTAFNFVHFRQLGPVFQLAGVENRGFEAWEETNFALLVNAMADPVNGALTLRMDFSDHRFSPGQADLHAETLVRALQLVVQHPDEPVDPSRLAPARPRCPRPREHRRS